MIRRDSGIDWSLISQIDHAHLAANLAMVWGNDVVPALPLREPLSRAIRLHDDGWYGWESRPGVGTTTGRPRDFTEMPMAEAAAIWTESIEIAGRGEPSRAESARRIDATSETEERFSPRQLAIVDEILDRGRIGARFDVEEIDTDGGSSPRDDETVVHRLIAAHVIRAHADSPLAGRRRFSLDVPLGSAPLEGTWVSRHFARLAEQARDHRDDPEDVAAAERFLVEQDRRRNDWMASIEAFAGEDTERVIEGGYRLLRFFDWVSLWICCGERDEGTDMELPGGPTIRFEPDGPARIRLDPWPLAVTGLEVSVPTIRVPNRPYRDSDDLAAAMRSADLGQLAWRLDPR